MGLKRKEIRDEKGHKGRKESGASGRAGRGQSRPGRAAVGTALGLVIQNLFVSGPSTTPKKG